MRRGTGGGERGESLPPALQRLRDTYPDLASGRFICLAHFEEPGEELLFRVVQTDGAPSEKPQPEISVRRSRKRTGAGGLKVHLAQGDLLRFDGARSEDRALVGDWVGYSIVLASIFGPRDGTKLEFGVESGAEPPLRWTTTVSVRAGWNLYRFDTVEIADRVDLADVRALTWRLAVGAPATDLYFDDIVLADNTRHLLGQHARAGEMYVFHQGRRLHVGAKGRYELAFSYGTISAWFDRGAIPPGRTPSPARAESQPEADAPRTTRDLKNLTLPSGLGPWPMPLASDWSADPLSPPVYDDPQLFAHWGPSVATSQKLVEASPFRVVVEGTWRFRDPANAASTTDSADGPGHSWSYVIYPSGHVYVRIVSNCGNAGWRTPRLGYALALDGRRGFARVAPSPVQPGRASAVFTLMARLGAERGDLLWVPSDAAIAARRILVESADERRVVVVVGDIEASPIVDTTHLLRVWPTDIDAAPEAESLARDFQNPATLVVRTGELRTDVAGDRNADGFNESQGCHEIALASGVARFTFDPGGQLRYQPVFRLHGTEQRRCWIYADGRIIRSKGRDQQGRLLFVLPRVIDAPVRVEINTRAKQP